MIGLVHGLRQVPVKQVVVLVNKTFNTIQHLNLREKRKREDLLFIIVARLSYTFLKTFLPLCTGPKEGKGHQYLAGVVLDAEAVVWQAVVVKKF